MPSPSELSQKTLNRLVEHLGLQEVSDDELSTGPATARMRVLAGGPVSRLVYVAMAFAPANLDSHMIFAFTAADSPVPHFTLDSVQAGPTNAFHLDLIPRVDLGAHLPYLDAVYGPLTDTYDSASQIEGLSAAQLSRRQWAIMSPWMLAYRADDSAFDAIEAPVTTYLDHWFSMVADGLPGDATEGAAFAPDALAARDQANRDILFNPEVDHVWGQVSQLLGEDTSERIRTTLRVL